MIALIPARAGSKRCPGKNTRLLNGSPLIAYTIAAALESGVFSKVIVASDEPFFNTVVMPTGAAFIHRLTAADDEADITWVRFVLDSIVAPSEFAILRPTSPFRTAATIRRAYEQFQAMPDRGDSLRAVELVTEHPGKMWICAQDEMPKGRMRPLMPGELNGVPWHSCPTQTLPPVYRQNASLEMAKRRCVDLFNSISGHVIYPFFTEGYEGFDINTEADFARAERLAGRHDLLPPIEAHVR